MFAALDKTSVVAAKDVEAKNLALITNMPIDDKFFNRHSAFFAAIGYIAQEHYVKTGAVPQDLARALPASVRAKATERLRRFRRSATGGRRGAAR